MKKSLAILLAVVLVCALLVVTVAGAGSASPTQGGLTGEGETSDIVITSILEAEGEMAERLEAAKDELEKNADDFGKLCADLADVEGLSVLDIVDVSWGDEAAAVVKQKGSVSVKFDTKLGKDAKAYLIFNENNAWTNLEVTIEDGSVVAGLANQGTYAMLVG